MKMVFLICLMIELVLIETNVKILKENGGAMFFLHPGRGKHATVTVLFDGMKKAKESNKTSERK